MVAQVGRKLSFCQDMAAAMGVELFDGRTIFREMQKLGEFDLKTSSWVKTPAEIRDLGGALDP